MSRVDRISFSSQEVPDLYLHLFRGRLNPTFIQSSHLIIPYVVASHLRPTSVGCYSRRVASAAHLLDKAFLKNDEDAEDDDHCTCLLDKNLSIQRHPFFTTTCTTAKPAVNECTASPTPDIHIFPLTTRSPPSYRTLFHSQSSVSI